MIDEENKSATMTEAPAAATAAPAHAAPAGSAPVEPEDTVFSLPLSHVTHDISDLADNEDEGGCRSGAHRRTCCGTAHSTRSNPGAGSLCRARRRGNQRERCGVCGTRARRAGVSHSPGIQGCARVYAGARGGDIPRGRPCTQDPAACARKRVRCRGRTRRPVAKHARAVALCDARSYRRQPAR